MKTAHLTYYKLLDLIWFRKQLFANRYDKKLAFGQPYKPLNKWYITQWCHSAICLVFLLGRW